MAKKRFEYIESDTEKLLTKCSCPNDNRIVVEDGVTMIGPGAFQNCKAEEIILPDSIKRIYENAFRSCKNLRHVNLGGKYVTDIGRNALAGCMNLEEVSFTNPLTFVIKSAFSSCCSELFLPYYFAGGISPEATLEALQKRQRKRTIKLSAGMKSIVVPRYTSGIGEPNRLWEEICYKLLGDNEAEIYAFTKKRSCDYTDHQNDDFTLKGNMYDMKRAIYTAMELYHLRDSDDDVEKIKQFFTVNAQNVCTAIVSDKNDDLFAFFINLGLLPDESLPLALELSMENNFSISTAYVLRQMQERGLKTNLDL